MEVDGALEELGAALAAVGVEQPSPPAALRDLEELEAAIAPMRLPADVRRFWQLVDAATLGVETYPELHGPDFALESRRMDGGEFRDRQPAALVQIAYTSHQCMSVELDLGEIEGGALFEWNLVDGDFERRFNRLSEWLAYVAGLIGAGSFRRFDSPNGPRLYVLEPDIDSEERASRPVPAPHPVHGRSLHVGRDILDWPEHWQRAAGLDPDALQPRGATHTIAALLSSLSTQRVRGTIAARVLDGMFTGGLTHALVDDGTAVLDVACPPATTVLGLRQDEWLEFDVVIEPAKCNLPSDSEVADAGPAAPPDRGAAEMLARGFPPDGGAAELLTRYGFPAVATAEAIRRLPAPP